MSVKLRLSTALCVFCFVLLSVSATLAQTATIAAWNIEGFSPIGSSKARRVAQAIKNLNPDVIVLTEVNPDSVATDIKNDLNGYSVKILPQTASQNIAILFKNSVNVQTVTLIPGSDDGNNRLRKALAAKVKVGNFDFILIGVHMKASRPRDTSKPTDPQRVRTRQATAIAGFIRQALNSSTERDVLVVGDYNMIPSQDGPNFTAMSPGSGPNELLRFISNSLPFSHINDCGDGDEPEGNLLDGFSISRQFTAEYVPNSIRLIGYNESVFSINGQPRTCSEYTDSFSDHLALAARFKTAGQDDD
jgi:endonuclease/exonuclease/phosphatase family metal-dependent hydrolase